LLFKYVAGGNVDVDPGPRVLCSECGKITGRDEADVVVVGAGPTGLVVAGELALAGVAVEVIERQATPIVGLPVPLNARPWRTRYPDGLLIPQDRLEEVLEAHLRVLGVAAPS
jgi:hypothetical protein